MTSRERVFLALDQKPADRIPIDFWASAAMKKKLEAGFGMPYEAFLDKHGV
jgi:hypothetical protein